MIAPTIKIEDCNLSSPPPLSSEEVHLWRVKLQLDDDLAEKAKSYLQPHQQEIYRRRNSAGFGHAYLATRHYLLHILQAYLQVPINDIVVAYSRLRKPHLIEPYDRLKFNFSVTRQFALFALTVDDEIGVDLEYFERRFNSDLLSRRKFSPEEQNYVGKPVEHSRALALWTRKEAYGKAIGCGINYPMKETSLLQGEENAFALHQANQWYYLHQFQLCKKHISCVVYARRQPKQLRAFKPTDFLT